MKTLVIGDIHGRSKWKSFGDIGLLTQPNISTDFDKYIFLGDYTDSFIETDEQIYSNLQDIIVFKNNYPENVVLLLGNHDLQYRYDYENHGCTGYRPQAYDQLHNLFIENKHLFSASYQIENYLFTHAGITSVWYNIFIQECPLETTIADQINIALALYNPLLFRVGYSRGGNYKTGGPFWADKSETMAYMFPNYHQIVGHTPVREIITHEWKEGQASITYCDTINTPLCLD